MHNDDNGGSGTGPLYLIEPKPADDEETFVLLPVVGEPGDFMAVFSDGSYTRWIPSLIRKVADYRPWELGVSLFGGLILLDALNVIPGL